MSPFLVIMDNAGTPIHVQAFVQTYVFNSLGYIPRKDIDIPRKGHWVTPCFKFLRKTPTCFPHQLYHCTSLPAVYKCSNFSTSLSMIAILVFLNYCCYSPSGFEVLSHLGFDLHFP